VKRFDDAVPALFEVGLGALALLILGGAIYFLAGHLVGAGRRQNRRSQPSPSAGSVSDHRHQNVTSVSVR